MKTATRQPTRTTAAPGARAKARVQPEPAERSIVSLELRAIEDLNQLTSRLLAVAGRRSRAPKAEGARDEFGALLAHELPLMERQLEHMSRIFDDLAVVARLNEGKVALSRMRVRLSDVFNGALQYARPALEEGGHEVTVSLPQKHVFLDADAARLAQAVGTLLVQSGRRAAREDLVGLSAVVESAEVVITVRDRIAANTRPAGSMFGIFPAVEADVGTGASGLCIGLALVKGLVELHGGTIMAESFGVGKATAFEVRLPILPD